MKLLCNQLYAIRIKIFPTLSGSAFWKNCDDHL